jgi:hypothetical protein
MFGGREGPGRHIGSNLFPIPSMKDQAGHRVGVPPDRLVCRRQADIFAQIGRHILGRTGPNPPGTHSGRKDRNETALMDSIGDGEFKTQHNAALGKRIMAHGRFRQMMPASD